jgi:PQQ-like domain
MNCYQMKWVFSIALFLGIRVPGLADSAELAWKVTLNSALPTGVALSQDSLFIGAGRNLYRLNYHGSVQWVVDTKAELSDSPTTTSDGKRVYIGGRGVSCISKEGDLLWNIMPEKRCTGVALSESGRIYFSDNESMICCTTSGKIAWQYPTGHGLYACPVGVGTRIYVTGADKLFPFSVNGTLEWSRQLGGDSGEENPMCSADGRVVVRGGKKVFCFLSDGELAWEYNVEAYVWSVVGNAFDRSVIIGGSDGTVAALSLEGKPLWVKKFGQPMSSSFAIDASGNLYVGVGDDFYCLSQAGEVLWKITTGKLWRCMPILGANILYVNTMDGHLFAFRTTQDAPNQLGWPMIRYDVRNSGFKKVGE